MKSKEEMIEIMAGAIGSMKSAYIEDELELAEAALRALCGALPDIPLKVIGDGSVVTFFADGLYNQLKQWGENNG